MNGGRLRVMAGQRSSTAVGREPPSALCDPFPPGEFGLVMEALRREHDMEVRMYPSPNPVLLAAASRLIRRQIGGQVLCSLAEIEGDAPIRLTAEMAHRVYSRYFDNGATSLPAH